MVIWSWLVKFVIEEEQRINRLPPRHNVSELNGTGKSAKAGDAKLRV